MSAHTPAPWTVGAMVGYPNALGVGTERGHAIAILTRDTHRDEAHQQANARLIAAAPIMLKTLRDILEEAEEREDTEDRPGGEGVRPNAWMIVAQLCRDALDATVGSHV